MEDCNFVKFDKATMPLNIGDIIKIDFYTTTITAINLSIICVDNGFASTTVKVDKIESVYPVQEQRLDNMTETLMALGLKRRSAEGFVFDMINYVELEVFKGL